MQYYYEATLIFISKNDSTITVKVDHTEPTNTEKLNVFISSFI